MSRLFYHVMQDNVGNLLFDVTGTMRVAGTGTLATIYGDEALSVVLPNPMTNHPSFGSFKCFLGAGDYDFYMAKAGYTFETLTGVQGHGTMAQQNANNVVITGGSVAGLTGAFTNIDVTGVSRFMAQVVTGTPAVPVPGVNHSAFFQRVGNWGTVYKPIDSDAGAGQPIMFQNFAGTAVGSITTTGAATAYNTASDGRLKHAIAPLTGALDVLRALHPVAFRWTVDDTPGHGLVAQEVQAVLPEVVTAVAPDGLLGIDYAKVVPWLIAACQTLAAQVETLTARLDAAGG